MTQEQKAKRYDEAIKKAELLYKAAEPMSGCNVIIETLFPELKESDDERIRKRLINYFHGFLDGYEDTYKVGGCVKWEGLDVKDIITWLEKQGHNSNYIHITQTIIDYINRNKEKFENDIPKLGDIWKVKEVCTYSYVNNGKPVVEIENSKGAWMRLPLDVVNIIQGCSTILSDSSNIEK